MRTRGNSRQWRLVVVVGNKRGRASESVSGAVGRAEVHISSYGSGRGLLGRCAWSYLELRPQVRMRSVDECGEAGEGTN